MLPLAIISSGMTTGVGFSAPASCAAIRCAIDGFKETKFIDSGGEMLIGCAVPFEQPWRGLSKLVRLAAPAISECWKGIPATPSERVPLLLCVAEKDRPGRIAGLDDRLAREILTSLAMRFHPRSSVIAGGRAAIGEALALARRLIYEEAVPCCVIAGVDSLLVGPTLTAYEESHHLLSSVNPDGFIPGEAAGAIVVAQPTLSAASDSRQLVCLGIGMARESATLDSEQPLRADGMVAAFRAALAEAERTLGDTDYRLCDLSGPQYYFKEAATAMNRVLRSRKELYEIWHPADCIGETGAAIGPICLGLALAAARQDYAPGAGALCHFSADDGQRAAMILSYTNVRAG